MPTFDQLRVVCDAKWMTEQGLGTEAIRAASRLRKVITIEGSAREESRCGGDREERVFVFERCKSNCNTSRLHAGGRVVVVVTVRGPQGSIAEAATEPLTLVSKSTYTRRLRAPAQIRWVDQSAEADATTSEGTQNTPARAGSVAVAPEERGEDELLQSALRVVCGAQWMAEQGLGTEAIKAACAGAMVRLEGRENGQNLGPCARCCRSRLKKLITIEGSAREEPRIKGVSQERTFLFERCKSNCNTSRLHMGGRVVIVVAVMGPQGPIAEAATYPLTLVSKTTYTRRPRAPPQIRWVDQGDKDTPIEGEDAHSTPSETPSMATASEGIVGVLFLVVLLLMLVAQCAVHWCSLRGVPRLAACKQVQPAEKPSSEATVALADGHQRDEKENLKDVAPCTKCCRSRLRKMITIEGSGPIAEAATEPLTLVSKSTYTRRLRTPAQIRWIDQGEGADLGPCARCCRSRLKKLITVEGSAHEELRNEGASEERTFLFERCKSNCNTSRLHMGGRVVIVVAVRGPEGLIAEAATEPLTLVSKTTYTRRPLAPPQIRWVDQGDEHNPLEEPDSRSTPGDVPSESTGAEEHRPSEPPHIAQIPFGQQVHIITSKGNFLQTSKNGDIKHFNIDGEWHPPRAKWVFEQRDGSVVCIKNVATNKYLHVPDKGVTALSDSCDGDRAAWEAKITLVEDKRGIGWTFRNCNTSRLHMGGRVVIVVAVRGPEGLIAEAATEPLTLVSKTTYTRRPLAPPQIRWVDKGDEHNPLEGPDSRNTPGVVPGGSTEAEEHRPSEPSHIAQVADPSALCGHAVPVGDNEDIREELEVLMLLQREQLERIPFGQQLHIITSKGNFLQTSKNGDIKHFNIDGEWHPPRAKWVFEQRDGSVVCIKNVATNKYLHVPDKGVTALSDSCDGDRAAWEAKITLLRVVCDAQWMAEQGLGTEAIKAACAGAMVRLEGRENGQNLGPCERCCRSRLKKLITVEGSAREEPLIKGASEERTFLFERCKSNCNTSRLHMGGRVVIVVAVRGPEGPIAEAATEPLTLVSKTTYTRRPLAPPQIRWVDQGDEHNPLEGPDSHSTPGDVPGGSTEAEVRSSEEPPQAARVDDTAAGCDRTAPADVNEGIREELEVLMLLQREQLERKLSVDTAARRDFHGARGKTRHH
eukprot:m51a1_g2805 hypothetical protein (1154) ;mRNA; r:98489-117997